jgi:hypothetical protein
MCWDNMECRNTNSLTVSTRRYPQRLSTPLLFMSWLDPRSCWIIERIIVLWLCVWLCGIPDTMTGGDRPRLDYLEQQLLLCSRTLNCGYSVSDSEFACTPSPLPFPLDMTWPSSTQCLWGFLQSPEELASCHESFITPPDTFYLPTPLALTLSVIIKKKS